ncbi:MAG: LacI family transcriptional regulator, partial [Lactobacillaceae bacterium]|nr:LacI family transcriptional regulator [Lactobacillaceae bacterium]
MSADKLPTIYDVAREAGVSLATVSRVINNTNSVKEATRLKVQDVIKKLDYHPNSLAKGLATSKSTTIGLIMPNLTDLFTAELAQGVDAVAKMYSYSVVASITANNENLGKNDALQSLLEKQVDGIIYMDDNPSLTTINELKATSVPVVFTGTHTGESQFASVSIDYEQAVQQAVEILKPGTKNQKIVLVAKNANTPVTGIEVEGFKKSLPECEVFYGDEYSDGYELGKKFIEQGIEAAVVMQDEVAAGIANYMVDNSIAVPNDFQLITSDDTKITQYTRPALSSITQPKFDIGAVAMRLLTKLLEEEEV